MSDFQNTLSILSSGLQSQAERLRRISENIANVDTSGYRRKTVTMFSDDIGRVQTSPTQLDQADLERVYDPAHPLADGTGHYLGSNVNVLFEIADAREAQRSYEANLKLFDQAKQMSTDLFDLLRK
jgi:flagellar basal-body rod protein FlgC